MKVYYGSVRFFNNQRGWGLINLTTLDGSPGEILFIHWRDISCPSFKRQGRPDKYKTLIPGEKVCFSIQEAIAPFTMRTAKDLWKMKATVPAPKQETAGLSDGYHEPSDEAAAWGGCG